MNEEVFVFKQAGKVEAAISKMIKALGTEKEGPAALAFAKSMIRLYETGGYRKELRDTDREKRLVFLRARYDMVNVHVRLMKEVEYVMALYGKYIDQYRAMGGSWAEDEAFRTGKTEEEVRAEDHATAEARDKEKAARLKELGL
ncbi:hypothetical protein FACS189493_7330 [Spirochaetia bacterium]|nr:hypothetical protein FACS189493_7330 [Spirochaetia bacterium]